MSPLAIGYAVTGVASLALVALAWRRPRAARFAFAALFLGASVVNAVTALRTPNAYVEGFAPHAFPPMRELIERVVALAPDAFVLAIAAGQLAAGVGLALGRGPLFHLAVVFAGSFLVAISWLGVGSAFPTNLVFAAGVALVWRGRARAA